jgi:hypothetical protein
MAPMRVAAAVVTLCLLAGPLAAQEAAPTPAPASSPAPATRKPANARIKLGAFAGTMPGEPPILAGPEVPRFATEVEVRGRAMDSAALTAKLAWWLRDFDGTRGPVRGAGRAPTLAEMREFRPHPADSVDVNEVVGWLVGKIKEKTKN